MEPFHQIAEPSLESRLGKFSPPVEGPVVIMESDDERAFQYTQTTRFGISLDETIHPFDQLDYSECDFFGYISDWSMHGPFSYPIGFEVTKEGSCVVRNRDFQVYIIGLPGR